MDEAHDTYSRAVHFLKYLQQICNQQRIQIKLMIGGMSIEKLMTQIYESNDSLFLNAAKVKLKK